MVYTERAEVAAVSCGTSHVTTKQCCKYITSEDIPKSTIRCNSHSFRITHDKSAVSLLESRAQHYVKAIIIINSYKALFSNQLSSSSSTIQCVIHLQHTTRHWNSTSKPIKKQKYASPYVRFCCLTSTEARRPIGMRTSGEKGDRRVKPRNRRQPRSPSL